MQHKNIPGGMCAPMIKYRYFLAGKLKADIDVSNFEGQFVASADVYPNALCFVVHTPAEYRSEEEAVAAIRGEIEKCLIERGDQLTKDVLKFLKFSED